MILRSMVGLENQMDKRVSPVLKKQWTDAIALIEHGNKDFAFAVHKYQQPMITAYRNSYKSAGEFYFDFVNHLIHGLTPVGKKDAQSIFWQTFSNWLEYTSLTKVVSITDVSTINILSTILDRGVREGMSYKEIAKQMRELEPGLNRYRADMIARTEIHTAYGEITKQTIAASGLQVRTKEWMAFIDQRTREPHARANGQMVASDDKFDVGGERLDYPGDSAGSAENIIHCRCVATYNTK